MRKLVALLLMVSLLLTASAALALDLSYVEENPDLFTIEPNEESAVAFIESTLTASQREFHHQNDSEYYRSVTQFDILVLEYGTDNAYPVWRLWISYVEDEKFQNFDSITFVVDGASYTFTEVSSPDWVEETTTSCFEDMMIKIGVGNLSFAAALETYCNNLETMEDFTATMILHGEEDITVELGEGFASDFLWTKAAYTKMGGFNTVGGVVGTTMVETTLETE